MNYIVIMGFPIKLKRIKMSKKSGRPSTGGHVRQFPRHKTSYRLISVTIDGVRRQQFEHRLVMERKLGRPLLRSEIVHHKDENGLNNTPENLELTTQSEHVRHHLTTGPRKWPLDEAIKLREEGWTFEQMGSHFGVAWTGIRNRFKKMGISTADKRHGTLKWDFDAAVDMYRKGTPLKQIARSVGVAPPSVRKAFRARGIILAKKED